MLLYCISKIYILKSKNRVLDIFLLNCIFAEMLTILTKLFLNYFTKLYFNSNIRAFYTILLKIYKFISSVYRRTL